MSNFWLFAYVALPVIVVAMGFGAVYLNNHSGSR